MVPLSRALLYRTLVPQEEFKDIVVAWKGFNYTAERPDEDTFVGQKWGWTSSTPGTLCMLHMLCVMRMPRMSLCTPRPPMARMPLHPPAPPLGGGTPPLPRPNAMDACVTTCLYRSPMPRTTQPCCIPACAAGDWAELEFDSRPNSDAKDGEGGRATIYLTHLKSYEGMGTAEVKCVRGCQCKKAVLDGTWDTEASLMQNLRFKVGLPSFLRLSTLFCHQPFCFALHYARAISEGGSVVQPGQQLLQAGFGRCARLALAVGGGPDGPGRGVAPIPAQVSPAAKCRVRVTVSNKAGKVAQKGHKVKLMAIMAR